MEANLEQTDHLSSLFERKGIFTINKEGISLDDIELDLIDAGAQDFDN